MYEIVQSKKRKAELLVNEAKLRARIRESKRLASKHNEDSYTDGVDFSIAFDTTWITEEHDVRLIDHEQQQNIDKIFKFHAKHKQDLDKSGYNEE